MGGGRRDGVGYWTHTVGIFGWLTFDPDCGGMTESEMRMGCHFSPRVNYRKWGISEVFGRKWGKEGGREVGSLVPLILQNPVRMLPDSLADLRALKSTSLRLVSAENERCVIGGISSG